MIIPMPDMWLTAMHQDLDDDDIDDYGRLIIDIPDSPDNADSTTENEMEHNTDGYTNTRFRDNLPTPVTEKETSCFTQTTPKPMENKPQRDFPSRCNRDIPIKLLLKRLFQNSKMLQEKQLKANKPEDETTKQNESADRIKKGGTLDNEHNRNRVETQETIGLSVSDDVSQISSQHYSKSEESAVSFERKNNHNKYIERRNEECLSANIHYPNQDDADQTFPQNYIKHTTTTAKPEKSIGCIESIKELLSTNGHNSNQVGQQTVISYASANNTIERASSQNCMKKKTSEYSETQSNHNKELLSTHTHNDKQAKTDQSGIYTYDVNQRASPRSCMKKDTSDASSGNENIINSIKGHKKKILTPYKYYSNKRQDTVVRTYTAAEIIDQRIFPPNYKENKRSDAQPQSSPFYQISQDEHKKRISVVSNDFLFQQRSKGETLGIPTKTKDCNQRSCPQMYQEALIDFMERQYQLAIRDNIPLTVNRKPLRDESTKRNPDTRLAEVIHVDQRNEPGDVKRNAPPRHHQAHNSELETEIIKKQRNFANQNITKNTPIVQPNSPSPDSQPDYNILVHRGPDVNRIVITIANDKEENNKKKYYPTFSGDQRVPESIINNTSYFEASQTSQRKRSYYYKEPSLRSFRRHLPYPHPRNQMRNTMESNRFYPSEHPLDRYNNEAFNVRHYSYLGNHYELPTPVIDYCYSQVVNGFLPWEVHNRRPMDRISRRSTGTMTNVHSSQNQYHLDSQEQPILLGPLNLSLKPLTVDDRAYPEMFPNYTQPIHDYY